MSAMFIVGELLIVALLCLLFLRGAKAHGRRSGDIRQRQESQGVNHLV